jgi:hypothetical protein
LKRKAVEQRGARTLVDDESGGGPVHAPCPKQRVAKPGGTDRNTKIIILIEARILLRLVIYIIRISSYSTNIIKIIDIVDDA